nr:Rnf-Nqr domain containing protein [Candidatus Cloacimonadota bacterium]
MEFISKIIIMAVSAIFINNFVLSRFLGLCPYLGVSKKLDSAFGMGMAVIFVMSLASAFTWIINQYILIPAGIEYLRTIAFILTIASLVQFVEMFIQKSAPALYKSLGVYLPLITTN